MFNVNRFLSSPQKIILEHNFKNYLYDSVNKYNRLSIEMNEKRKKKEEMEKILYGNVLIKSNNYSQYELINNSKYHNFIFIISVVSIGALLFYKSK
jgi:hypothetical protein